MRTPAGEGPAWGGGWKFSYLETRPGCLGRGRGFSGSHGRAWLPTGPDGKGQLQAAGGCSAAWRLEAWAPGRATWEGQPQAVGVPTSRAKGTGNSFRPFRFKHTHCETTGPKPPFRGLPLPASRRGGRTCAHTSGLEMGDSEAGLPGPQFPHGEGDDKGLA